MHIQSSEKQIRFYQDPAVLNTGLRGQSRDVEVVVAGDVDVSILLWEGGGVGLNPVLCAWPCSLPFM